MTSRERVLAAIAREEPDRIPVDLGGMRSTGIHAQAYAGLKSHLGIEEGEITIFDATQQTVLVEASVRERLGLDVVILDDAMLGEWRPYTLPDGSVARVGADFLTEADGRGGEYQLDPSGLRVRRRPAGAFFFDPIHFPLADASSMADLNRHDWDTFSEEDLRPLRAEAQRLHDESDDAILGSFGGAFLEDAQFLLGYERCMMALAAERNFIEALFDKLLEQHLKNVELYLQSVGDCIDVIQMGGDLGMQTGPQISPKMYETMIQPRQKALWSRIHELAPHVAVFLHSCGGIYEFLPGIVDAGCDIINPIQISAVGMEPARLKREFGDKLCFWGGGCDTQQVLPFGTPEQVYAHTKANIEIFKPGGGFVFSQVQNILPDVPPENIMAMYDAVHDCWRY